MKQFSIVIAGGGSTYTPDMLEMLCLVREHFPLRRVVLYDNDAERQEHIGRFGEILYREYYPEAEFVYTTDEETAFTDIDFALVQIRPGGLKMREMDEKIPLKYGVIGQETCGPRRFCLRDAFGPCDDRAGACDPPLVAGGMDPQLLQSGRYCRGGDQARFSG